jgi:NADH:ubiquinone oxidoreductase subunit C
MVKIYPYIINQFITVFSFLFKNNTIKKNYSSVIINLYKKESLKKFLKIGILNNFLQTNYLRELTVVDYPFNTENRFQLVVVTLSIKFTSEIQYHLQIKKNETIESISSLFISAE